MRHKSRYIFKKAVKNYFEIYVQANLKIIKKKNKKKIYKKFKSNIVGDDITAEFPTNSDIKIKNDFKVSINKLSQLLKKKLDNFKFDFD